MKVDVAWKDVPGWGMPGTVRRHDGSARYQTGAEATISSEPMTPPSADRTNTPQRPNRPLDGAGCDGRRVGRDLLAGRWPEQQQAGPLTVRERELRLEGRCGRAWLGAHDPLSLRAHA